MDPPLHPFQFISLIYPYTLFLGPPRGDPSDNENQTKSSLKSIDLYKSPMSNILVAMAICNKSDFTREDQEQATVRIDMPGYKNNFDTLNKNQTTWARKYAPKIDFSALNQ